MSPSLAFLKQQTKDLANNCEGTLMEFLEEGRWRVENAPQALVELLAKRIVGVEIEITGIEGMAKLGQDMLPDLESLRVRQTRESLPSDLGLFQGKKIKSLFDWYYTKRKPWFWETLGREDWAEMVVVLAAVMVVGYALGSFLGWVYYRVWKY
jgi:hypothetical protein